MSFRKKKRNQVSLKKINKAGTFKSTQSNCPLTVIQSALKKTRSAVKGIVQSKMIKNLIFFIAEI